MNEPERDRVSALLRDARQSAGLSLRELARRAGTSHSTILAYEHGTKVPTVTTFLRLLRACDYAVELRLERRIRQRDGLERGEELEEVLRLAEQFPVRIERSMRFPRWP